VVKHVPAGSARNVYVNVSPEATVLRYVRHPIDRVSDGNPVPVNRRLLLEVVRQFDAEYVTLPERVAPVPGNCPSYIQLVVDVSGMVESTRTPQ